jgi:hypothetical protein
MAPYNNRLQRTVIRRRGRRKCAISLCTRGTLDGATRRR